MVSATFEIKNPKILKTYSLEGIKSTLEMILTDLENDFVEFGELSDEEFDNLPKKTKKKFENFDKLEFIEL
jgi:hypothetical protein